MIYCNEIQKSPAREDIKTLLILLNPFAPHMTEELWERLGEAKCLALQAWPSYEEKYLKDQEIEYAVQVNGKLRGTFVFAADATQETVAQAALALERVQTALNGKTVAKTIVVPNRLVNIIAR